MPRIKADKIILGIDPGTNFTGYGVIAIKGNKPECLGLGHINVHKEKDAYKKLKVIFDNITILIDKYRPDEVALESPFFGENVQSMLKLGRAQGVAMAAALVKDIAVYEYAPRKIKQAITGNGASSKEQVASLLRSTLKVDYTLKKLDATDGLAVALCHYFENNSPLAAAAGAKTKVLKTAKRTQSWEGFISENPDREIKNCKETKEHNK